MATQRTHMILPDTRAFTITALLFLVSFASVHSAETTDRTSKTSGLRLATFDIDATPPVGSHMAYDPVTNKWDLGLRARGIVLLGADQPIVLCAIDWIGIANESQDA